MRGSILNAKHMKAVILSFLFNIVNTVGDMNGLILQEMLFGISLKTFRRQCPLRTQVTEILIFEILPGDYQFGEVKEYNDIEISLLDICYGTYTLSVVVYVEGGNYPIPSTGKDYTGLQNIALEGDTIIVEEPFELELLQSF